MFSKCGDEFFDPYADTSTSVPICKSDSLLCSQIKDQVQTGAEFCRFLGFPVSKLAEPTMSKEDDCFNGRSSVGPKYDRLDIDYSKVRKRDYSSDDVDLAALKHHPLDWDFVDENGEDVFDRIGGQVFGGDGIVTSLYHYMVMPILKISSRIYRKYLRGLFAYLALLFAAYLSYELFYRRRVHKRIEAYCCKK